MGWAWGLLWLPATPGVLLRVTLRVFLRVRTFLSYSQSISKRYSEPLVWPVLLQPSTMEALSNPQLQRAGSLKGLPCLLSLNFPAALVNAD